jgi:hypothetical protein
VAPLRSQRRCSICGGPHLARGLCSTHYSHFLHDGTLNNYSCEDGDPVLPVREPWTWPGDEASLIAKLEAEDLTARVEETLEHMRQEAEHSGERTFLIGGVHFRVTGTPDEMNAKEKETRQYYGRSRK